MKSIVPQYTQPNPPGAPCEHCGALVKGAECPKDLMLRWEMSMGYVDPFEALPKRYHGQSCLSDFGPYFLERETEKRNQSADRRWLLAAIVIWSALAYHWWF